jgi:hypothetical protein
MMTDLDLYKITLSLFDKEITQADLDSDTPSREIRLCRLYKDLAQVRAMREFDWSFLVVKLQMDYEDDEPGRGFQHGYLLPLIPSTSTRLRRGDSIRISGKPMFTGS